MAAAIGSGSTVNMLPPPPEEVEWRSWPLLDQRPWPIGPSGFGRPTTAEVEAWAPYLFLVSAAAVGWNVAGWLGTGVLLIVTTSFLWRWWLPVRISAGQYGIAIAALRWQVRYPWRSFSGYEIGVRGVVVFLVTSLTAVHRLRSIYLPFDADRRIVAQVEYHLQHRFGE